MTYQSEAAQPKISLPPSTLANGMIADPQSAQAALQSTSKAQPRIEPTIPLGRPAYSGRGRPPGPAGTRGGPRPLRGPGSRGPRAIRPKVPNPGSIGYGLDSKMPPNSNVPQAAPAIGHDHYNSSNLGTQVPLVPVIPNGQPIRMPAPNPGSLRAPEPGKVPDSTTPTSESTESMPIFDFQQSHPTRPRPPRPPRRKNCIIQAPPTHGIKDIIKSTGSWKPASPTVKSHNPLKSLSYGSASYQVHQDDNGLHSSTTTKSSPSPGNNAGPKPISSSVVYPVSRKNDPETAANTKPNSSASSSNDFASKRSSSTDKLLASAASGRKKLSKDKIRDMLLNRQYNPALLDNAIKKMSQDPGADVSSQNPSKIQDNTGSTTSTTPVFAGFRGSKSERVSDPDSDLLVNLLSPPSDQPLDKPARAPGSSSMRDPDGTPGDDDPLMDLESVQPAVFDRDGELAAVAAQYDKDLKRNMKEKKRKSQQQVPSESTGYSGGTSSGDKQAASVVELRVSDLGKSDHHPVDTLDLTDIQLYPEPAKKSRKKAPDRLKKVEAGSAPASASKTAAHSNTAYSSSGQGMVVSSGLDDSFSDPPSPNRLDHSSTPSPLFPLGTELDSPGHVDQILSLSSSGHVHGESPPQDNPGDKTGNPPPAEPPRDRTDQQWEDWCAVCQDGGDDLLCCDRCPKVFHGLCHVPTIQEPPEELPDDWKCGFCSHEVRPCGNNPEMASGKLVPQMQKICERILLSLFTDRNGDGFQRAVAEERYHAPRYYSIIRKPMDLSIIKGNMSPGIMMFVLQICERILLSLFTDRNGDRFQRAVDEERDHAPRYLGIIRKLMDLSTIKGNVFPGIMMYVLQICERILLSLFTDRNGDGFQRAVDEERDHAPRYLGIIRKLMDLSTIKGNVFPGIMMYVLQICERILLSLFTDRNGDGFQRAVAEERYHAPRYYSIIRKPMDLSIIKGNMSPGIMMFVLQICERILLSLFTDRNGDRFQRAVDEERDHAPRYLGIIRKLMDLSTIKGNVFPGIMMYVLQICERILLSLFTDRNGDGFQRAVDEERDHAPRYLGIIRKLMDLSTIKGNVFPGIMMYVLQICERILLSLFTDRNGDGFQRAVAEERYHAPRYYSIIRKPMDLSIIKGNMSPGIMMFVLQICERILLSLFTDRNGDRFQRAVDEERDHAPRYLGIIRKLMDLSTIKGNVFPGMMMFVLQICERILLSLFTDRNGDGFQRAVDEERDHAPRYYSIIRKPMDLSTIKGNLAPGSTTGYGYVGEFLADLNQIFINMATYNDRSCEIFSAGATLWREYKCLVNLYLPTFASQVVTMSHLENCAEQAETPSDEEDARMREEAEWYSGELLNAFMDHNRKKRKRDRDRERQIRRS